LQEVFGIYLLLLNLERLEIKGFWELVGNAKNFIFGRAESVFGILKVIFGSGL